MRSALVCLDDDYGAFGKGVDGFLMYQQSVDDAHRDGGGGRGGGSGVGWLIAAVIIAILLEYGACVS